jgi:hypothetical protein
MSIKINSNRTSKLKNMMERSKSRSKAGINSGIQSVKTLNNVVPSTVTPNKQPGANGQPGVKRNSIMEPGANRQPGANGQPSANSIIEPGANFIVEPGTLNSPKIGLNLTQNEMNAIKTRELINEYGLTNNNWSKIDWSNVNSYNKLGTVNNTNSRFKHVKKLKNAILDTYKKQTTKYNEQNKTQNTNQNYREKFAQTLRRRNRNIKAKTSINKVTNINILKQSINTMITQFTEYKKSRKNTPSPFIQQITNESSKKSYEEIVNLLDIIMNDTDLQSMKQNSIELSKQVEQLRDKSTYGTLLYSKYDALLVQLTLFKERI